jgi:hypothetical protein
LIVVTLSLVGFAVHVPTLVDFTVVRSDDPDRFGIDSGWL